MQKCNSIAILLIFAVLLSGSYIDTIAAATISETTSNTQNLSNNISEFPLNMLSVQSTINNIVTIIITGIVTTCTSGDPFEDVTVTLNSLSGELLGSTTTDSNGFYTLIFQYTEDMLQSLGNTFQVTASYPGHIPSTKEVTVTPKEATLTSNVNDPVDSNLYGNVNFQLGTLNLIKGSWDYVGMDANNPSGSGPQQCIIQIHITNNGSSTATDVYANLSLGTSPIFSLANGESSLKYIGNLTAGQTKDVWYLIQMTNTTKPSNENVNYNMTVWSNNNLTNNNTINGTLVRDGYNSQERNSVINVTLLNTTPIRTGDTFQMRVVSETSSDFVDLILPLLHWDPTVIQPVNYTVNFLNKSVNTTSNNLVLHNPSKTTFYSTWTFVALKPGNTTFYPFIEDASGNSEHYNSKSSITMAQVLNVTPKVDVASTKTVSNLNRPGQTIQYNDLINYIIKISNYGPDNATGVTYKDLLPTGLIYVNHTISTNGGTSWAANSTAYNTSNGTWNIGNIAANSINQLILNITARVNTSGLITNNANKTTLNEFDSNLTNDNSTVTIYVPRADVYSEKTVSNLNHPGKSIQYNDLIFYNITISNAGPNDATGVVYQDLLPTGLIYFNHSLSTDGGTSWAANSTSYNSTNGIWNIGNIAADTINQFILQITARVNATDFITNDINKTAMNEFDTNLANDNDTVTIYVPKADVGVSTSILPANCYNQPWPPAINQIILFQINATNYSLENAATGVSITDILPSSVTYKDYSLSTDGGITWTLSKNLATSVYNDTTGIWNVGNLTTGSSKTLMIRGTVNQNNTLITNTANKTAQNEYDPNTANDNSTSSVFVPG